MDPSKDLLARLQQLAILGELGAGVTHETRNLMTGILGFAQVGRQRAHDPESARRYLEMIEREAMRCLEILERFLQFTRIDSGETVDVDLGKLAQEVANATSYQLATKQIKLTVVVGELPTIRARRGELQQVILNLIVNAMHATPRDGSIAIAVGRIGDHGCERDGIELSVQDSGAGVPAELRDKIFEAFFTTKAAGEGTGLGLALCRRIITSHGGTIEVDPNGTQGARFVIRIPASAQAGESPRTLENGA